MRAILIGLLLLAATSPVRAAERNVVTPQPGFDAGRDAAARPAPASAATTRRSGDGPAWVLNGFVLKEAAQCRQEDGSARRDCCERLLHPNACR